MGPYGDRQPALLLDMPTPLGTAKDACEEKTKSIRYVAEAWAPLGPVWSDPDVRQIGRPFLVLELGSHGVTSGVNGRDARGGQAVPKPTQ